VWRGGGAGVQRPAAAQGRVAAAKGRRRSFEDEGDMGVSKWRWHLKFSESQPRVPAGSPEGGQWTSSVHPHIMAAMPNLVQLQNVNPGKEVLILLDKDGKEKLHRVGKAHSVETTDILGEEGMSIHTHPPARNAFGFSWHDLDSYVRQKPGFRKAIAVPDPDLRGDWTVIQISGIPNSNFRKLSGRDFNKTRDKLWDSIYTQHYQEISPMDAAIKMNRLLMEYLGLEVSMSKYESGRRVV
jgi:hypothetical protein